MYTPSDGEFETWQLMPPSLTEKIRQDLGPDAATMFGQVFQHRLIFYAEPVRYATDEAYRAVRQRYPPRWVEAGTVPDAEREAYEHALEALNGQTEALRSDGERRVSRS